MAGGERAGAPDGGRTRVAGSSRRLLPSGVTWSLTYAEHMLQLTGHFDGKVFVPDEPVDLPVGHSVRIVVEAEAPTREQAPSRKNLFGSCRGMFRVAEDFDAPLDCFAGYRP